MTCAGRSRSRSLVLPVSARTRRTWSGGNVLAITPRLIRSLSRMPAGRPAEARAIAALVHNECASMGQLYRYVHAIGLKRGPVQPLLQAGEDQPSERQVAVLGVVRRQHDPG